jgi:hypothetical protein
VLNLSPVGLDPSTTKGKVAGGSIRHRCRCVRLKAPLMPAIDPSPLPAELRLPAAEVRSWTAKDEHVEASTFSPACPMAADRNTRPNVGC